MNQTQTSISRHALAGQIKARAGELGFDRVGIAPAQPSAYRAYLRQWLDEGRAGDMRWLEDRFDERADVGRYVPGAQSIVCVAANYHAPLEEPTPEQARSSGRIARYALGDDYHELFKPRLHQLADWLRSQVPQATTRCCVDTAPVMEKELAARAGLGWMGKNTCIIHEQLGSWLLLGEVITTIDLPIDTPAIDRCGSCTRCLDACPTGAITAPYQLDARRCISYLTIEHRQEIPAEYHRPIGDWLYGCDICQEVCPWNHRAPWTEEPAFAPRFPSGGLDVNEVAHWTSDNYRAGLRNSAIKRVKLPVLQRNARIVAENLSR